MNGGITKIWKRIITSVKQKQSDLSDEPVLFHTEEPATDSNLAKIDALMEVAGYDNEKLLQEYKALRVITDLKAQAPFRNKPLTPKLIPACYPVEGAAKQGMNLKVQCFNTS